MKDQADMLRTKMLKVRNRSDDKPKRNTKVIAVLSGKGGVGKSNFTVNFAIALQKLGKKVAIFDLDIGMANIDILLGMATKYSIVDMLEKDLSIWDIIEEGPEGLSFIAGGSGLNGIFEMDQMKMDYFIRELSSLEQEFDYILFDMAAGVSNNMSHFLLSAHEIFLVTTPEPTAITDAYAAIKYINFKDEAMPVSLIVNRTRHRGEGSSTSENMANVCIRFLNKQIKYLTSIPDDEVVWKSVRSQIPFLLMSPQARPSVAVYQAAANYIEKHNHVDVLQTANEQSFVQKLKGLFRR